MQQSPQRNPNPPSTTFLIHPSNHSSRKHYLPQPCEFPSNANMMMNKGILNLELTKSNAIIIYEFILKSMISQQIKRIEALFPDGQLLMQCRALLAQWPLQASCDIIKQFQTAAKVAVLCLLITYCSAVSVLTTANCPDNYDLKAANASDSGYSSATIKAIYGGIYSASDQAILQQSFSEGNTGTVYGYVTSMSILFPFILIAVAFGIAYIVAICCCVFEKTCPPCVSWKRDFTKNPYDKVELKCTSVFTVGFALAIVIAAGVGLYFSPTLQSDVKMVKCSLYYSLDIALNGDVSSNWGGFTQFSSHMSNITAQLTNAGTAITSTFGTSNSLSSKQQALRQQNINIYQSNYQSTVYSPNHITTNNSIQNNLALPTITPLFITSSLGPETANNTMAYDVDQALNLTQKVTDQATQVFSSSRLLFNSLSSISSKFNSSLNSMSSNAQYLTSAQASIDTFSTKVFDDAFTKLLYLIQGVLVLVLVSSILILLGVLATYYFQVFACKACVHLGWLIYGISYYGIITLCVAFFSLGGISYTFCQFYGGIVQNQSQLSVYSSSTKPTAFNHIFRTLTPCFYGNGSISASFTMTSETATVSKLYSDINTYLNMLDSSKATYVNLNTSIDIINAWITTLGKYKSGVYVDALSTVITEDNPAVALRNMNDLSNNSTGCTKDYWVFDKTNCSGNATEVVYSATVTSGTAFPTTGFLCISLNQKYSSSSNNVWSISDFISRYITRRQCYNSTSSFDSLLEYATSLINYRDSRINLYQNLQDQMTALLNANVDYNNNISAFTAQIISFNANTSALNSLMTSSINGINYASNCTVVADNLRLFYRAYCVNFIYKAVQFGICCIILLCMMVGGMLTGSVFAIRYGRIEQDPKVYLKDPPIIFQDELSSKREDSSQTSSSQEE